MNMKRIVLTMIALCCLVVAKAQTDVPIAVLQSGNNVSVFKGAGGLAAAHAAATLLSLSPFMAQASNPTRQQERVLPRLRVSHGI